MELLQWIVPLDDGTLAVAWTATGAERLPAMGSLGRAVVRRGAPLLSPHLPMPLAIGSFEDASDGGNDPVSTTTLSVDLGLAVDGPESAGGLARGIDDVRFAGLFSELVLVLAELAEAARLPLMGISPVRGGEGIELVIGPLGTASCAVVGDALLLFRTAAEFCCQARGLRLSQPQLVLQGNRFPLDAHATRTLALRTAERRASEGAR